MLVFSNLNLNTKLQINSDSYRQILAQDASALIDTWTVKVCNTLLAIVVLLSLCLLAPPSLVQLVSNFCNWSRFNYSIILVQSTLVANESFIWRCTHVNHMDTRYQIEHATRQGSISACLEFVWRHTGLSVTQKQLCNISNSAIAMISN